LAAKDMIGRTYESLTAFWKMKNANDGTAVWMFRCSCGSITKQRGTLVRAKKVVSCGCKKEGFLRKKRRTHGKGKHPLYQTWYQMISRCNDKRHRAYHRYGGRGIKVCEKWKNFEAFLDDMENTYPGKGFSLDRIDNDDDYSFENCRWATSKVQQNNMSFNRHVRYKGKLKTISEWATIYGLRSNKLNQRIFKLKWPIEKALTTK